MVGTSEGSKGEKLQEPERTARSIEAPYSNFFAANAPKAKTKRGGWTRPLEDHAKINVDASFDEDSLRGTTGAVIRDSSGFFIAAGNTKLESVQDTLSAEAHALTQGLILEKTMGCNRIIISSDCMEVTSVMQQGGNSHGIAAAVFLDCYHLATENLKFQFENSYREANVVAHKLARTARGSDEQVWLDDPPGFIMPLLLADVTIISYKKWYKVFKKNCHIITR